MPLCPQITNTPITVTQNSDFDVASTIPLIGNTYDGLASNLESIEVLADGKTKVYRSATEPTGAGINDGDLWIDIDDGNKLYVRASGVWVSAQDAGIATASAEAAAASAAAAAAVATANSAAATAGAAQSTANTALANAATAYTAATDSLQPSANTIVNASNQITAINGNGITVYSGASATSGARVVLNSAGLAGFNAGGTATFSISASTGAAVFSGSVTGSTITGGTLNIAGNAIIDSAGLLTATGATITGTINATAGYFGTASNGFSISSTGLVGVGAGTIVGGTIQGATFNNGSGTFFVSSAGVVTAISGTIGGWSLSSTSISKTVGTKTMTLDSSNAILTIADTSTGVFSGGGINITSSGGSVTGSYGSGTIAFANSASSGAISLTSSDILIESGGTGMIRLRPGAGLGSDVYDVQVEGHLNVPVYSLSTGTFSSSSTSQTTGTYISAGGAIIARRDNIIPIFAHRYNATGTTEMIRLVYNGADAGGIQTSSAGSPSFRTTSDYRLKKNIHDYTGASDIIKSLRVRSYEMNNNPGKTEIGFIAHEYAETVPDMVNGVKDGIDADGNPEYQSISTTNLIPYIVGALKEALLRIETLEGGNK